MTAIEWLIGIAAFLFFSFTAGHLLRLNRLPLLRTVMGLLCFLIACQIVSSVLEQLR